MRLSLPSIGVLAATLLCLSEAQAENIILNAVSYAEIPPGNTVTVEVFDDAEATLKLKRHLEELLKRNGYAIEAGARLIFSMEARETAGSWSGGGPNRLIELQNSDNHTGTDAPNVRVNIFDSQRGGLLNQKRDKGIDEVTPSQFRIDVTLEDRQNGRRLWQGWTAARISASEDVQLGLAMVKPIVDSIGKTVRQETFPAP